MAPLAPAADRREPAAAGGECRRLPAAHGSRRWPPGFAAIGVPRRSAACFPTGC